jgi:hypothetical protein
MFTPDAASFTDKHGQYLAFIYAHTCIAGEPRSKPIATIHRRHSSFGAPTDPHPRAVLVKRTPWLSP